MQQRARNGHRGRSAAVLLVGGGAVVIAAWIGGHPEVAAVVFVAYILLAVVAFVWSGGRGDVAAIMRSSADERQRGIIDLRASAGAFVTAVFAIGAAVVSIARTVATPGPTA